MDIHILVSGVQHNGSTLYPLQNDHYSKSSYHLIMAILYFGEAEVQRD